MKELGEYLKVTRVSNGVSIEEAAEDMEISATQLENIEEGNVRAFKDVYKLKEYVARYAKYLGLEPDKVMDEFNDFLFEHTSKISLEDILEAKKKTEEKEERLKSPYTKEYKKKFNYAPLIFAIFLSILIAILVYVILSSVNKTPVRDTELKGQIEGGIYEYTY